MKIWSKELLRSTQMSKKSNQDPQLFQRGPTSICVVSFCLIMLLRPLLFYQIKEYIMFLVVQRIIVIYISFLNSLFFCSISSQHDLNYLSIIGVPSVLFQNRRFHSLTIYFLYGKTGNIK